MDKFNKIHHFVSEINEIILTSNIISIDNMAQSINLSKSHFIRLFTEFSGITPLQFLHMIILNNAKRNLRRNKTLLESTLDLGLSSSSRLHDIFIKTCAVSPEQYKNYGYGMSITHGIGLSPFGKTQIGFTNKGVCFLRFIEFEDIKLNIQEYWKNADLITNNLMVQENINYMFMENKIKNNNIKLNLWNAIFNLPANEAVKDFWDKNIDIHNVILKVVPNFQRCYESIIRSGAVSNYRWGVAPTKKIHLYKPVMLRRSYDS